MNLSNWILFLFFFNDAATETTLRDNAALRQKSLFPVVLHLVIPDLLFYMIMFFSSYNDIVDVYVYRAV